MILSRYKFNKQKETRGNNNERIKEENDRIGRKLCD